MGWRNVPLRADLAERIRIPMFVDNDGNATALAERYFGVAQGMEDFAYVVGNIGLGAGLVIGGHILAGVSGYAGEAGHTTIDPDGQLCRCGNHGCWEALASQRALIERVGELRHSGPSTVPTGSPPSERSGEISPQFSTPPRAKTPSAVEALHQTGTYLGIGIADWSTCSTPVGRLRRCLSLAHEFLMPAAHQVVEQRAIGERSQPTRIVVSSLGQDACVLGGVALVLHDILSRQRLAPNSQASPTPKRDELTSSQPERDFVVHADHAVPLEGR